MKLLTVLLCLAPTAFADRVVRVEWDGVNGAEGFRVWNSTGTTPTLLAAVPITTAEIEIPETEQRITVTAWSLTGESAHSLPLTIPANTQSVTLTLQHSTDNVTWQTRSITYYQETSPTGFYRLKIETHEP